MKNLSFLADPGWWQTLCGSDFNKGFMAALCLVLLLMVLLLIFRGIFYLIFRTRRCSSIEVKRADGSTFVDRDVIASLVDRELQAYPAISAEKIVLTRKGKSYQLTIYCSYLLSDPSGIPAFCDEFKPKFQSALEKGFGITSLEKIRLWISDPNDDAVNTEPAGSHVQEKDAYIGL